MDYQTNVTGLTYYNEQNQSGVAIDGQGGQIVSGDPHWEMVTARYGSVVYSNSVDTNISTVTVSSYYLDSSKPSVNQCTGDSAAWGESGIDISGSGGIPCTDPTRTGAGCSTNQARGIRRLLFAPAGQSATQAEELHNEAESPETISEQAF
jgi:hypothetical protein